MTYTTYSLVPHPNPSKTIVEDVARLSRWVLAEGKAARDIWQDYQAFVGEAGRESPRSLDEYLLEGLLVGVMWRTRGDQARRALVFERSLVDSLVRERRARLPKRRDGSTARLLADSGPSLGESPYPSLVDFSNLMTWLLCTGEYDDEVGRLAGWEEFLGHPGRDGGERLRRLVDFARDFEVASNRLLGRYTARVETFLSRDFALRPPREDTLQCSRPRLEYHFNILGAEILNRAWRNEFLATERQILVLPGCMRRRGQCAAIRQGVELRCTHCDPSCPAGKATAIASRAGMESTMVLHGSGFGETLRRIAARGTSIGIVGVACVPGLVGAGWRAKDLGLPAQCVLLEFSGCGHWQPSPAPSTFDFATIDRIMMNQKFREVSLQGAKTENMRL